MIPRTTTIWASIAASVFFLFAPSISLAAQVSVSIGDDYFSAKTTTIHPGDTVTWINHGSMAHTVTADDGSFDSGTIAPGASYTHTFSSTGSVAYYCKFHGGKGGVGMAGVIAAQSAPASAVSAAPPASAPAAPTASANSVSSLQAQLAQLTQTLSQLQQQKSGTAASCPSITTPIDPGSSGSNVTALQQFLARDPSIYPEAMVTGYYGNLTTTAVQRFQIKYHIVTSGSPSTTGFGRVGPKTLEVINSLCGVAADTVGAFMQVSPDAGSAPLTVNIQATVNTSNSCASAVYTLDYGDQSPQNHITIPAGNCQPLQQTYTHTYTGSALYEITLSSGTHSSQAQVVVQPSQSQ